MSQLHPIFFDEARDNLDLMERSLLRFNPASDEKEQLNAIFRAAHSVKGGASAFGFADVVELAHLAESALDRMRGRQVKADALMIDLLLESVDAMRALLASHHNGSGGIAQNPDDLVRRLRVVALSAEPSPAARSLVIRIGPVGRIEELQAVAALFRDIPGLGAMAELPDSGDGMHTFAVRTDSSDEELLALFAFHVAREMVTIRTVAQKTSSVAPPAARHHAGAEEAAWATSTAVPRDELATIRVASVKVDLLADLTHAIAGNLAALQRSSRALDAEIHPQLLSVLAELQRNSLELQQSVLAIRMMPMAVVFHRFPRMLRELERRLGKKLALVTQGEDIELDKGLVEKIADPLMHMVRNSCDHGIETPAERTAAGKPETGTITLSVAKHEAWVTIAVGDDGRGLSRAKILKGAAERGLDVPEQIEDAALWQLVFEPGFSTAVDVTDVSGRGVGLDVVKRNVSALGGVVEIESTPGLGTCVSMRLPLGGN